VEKLTQQPMPILSNKPKVGLKQLEITLRGVTNHEEILKGTTNSKNNTLSSHLAQDLPQELLLRHIMG